MKTRKLIVGMLIFLAIVLLSIFSNKTQASSLGYVKIQKARIENGITYKHQLYSRNPSDTKNIWKLVSCNQNGTASTNPIPDLYCLRAGLGFRDDEPNPTEHVDIEQRVVQYNQSYNMTQDYQSLVTYFKGLSSPTNIFDEENSDKFYSVMWILDHMLLEGATDVEVREYLKTYAGYTDETLDIEEENILSKADIEVIQQLAIWHFTNNDQEAYNKTTLPTLFLSIKGRLLGNTGENGEEEYQTFTDIFNTDESYGTQRQRKAAALYNKLITDAKNVGTYRPKREIIVYLAGGNAAEEQPIVKVEPSKAEIDVALRKFITSINGEEINTRIPQVNTKELNKGNVTTATYNHTKKPLRVEMGDIVTYTLRLYNEGEVDTYIKEVTDYLPAYLQYVPYGNDKGSFWELDKDLKAEQGENYDGEGRIATTKAEFCVITGVGGKIPKSEIGKKLVDVKIPAAEYRQETKDYELSYVDIQISCEVIKSKNTPYDTNITNIAQITKMADEDGHKNGTLLKSDRDSIPNGNFRLPTDDELPRYKDNETNKQYVPGQEDDDDFEKVYIETPVIDLALRKFISAVGETKYDRAPIVDTSGLRKGEQTAIYNHSKLPVQVKIGNVVTYTLRIYNEGDVPGKVTQVTDYLAPHLKYIQSGKENNGAWWTETIGTDYNKLVSTPNCKIVNVGGNTDKNYVGQNLADAIIPAYDKENDTLSYLDIEVNCVVQQVEKTTKVTNIAEITGETDENGNPVEKDRDSNPDNLPEYVQKPTPGYKDNETDKPYVPGNEDDDDFEKVIVIVPEVDLSLRKYISSIDGEVLSGDKSREPVVDTTIMDNKTSTTSEYKHSKKPIMVNKGSEVIYTIRVYNEGEVNAYVSEITDYLPNYLIYLPENEINKKYGWDYDEKTRQVKTTITSQENEAGNEIYKDRENGKLLVAYDGNKKLDSIDVQIVCKVDEKALGNGILTNLAQITEVKDENGKVIEEDRDSKPDGDKDPAKDFEIPSDKDRPTYKDEESDKPYVPGQEDDDDFEKVLVKPDFDLALRKFITQVENTPINNRITEVSYENVKISYKHTKVPVDVETGDIVIYTIRVYNEGEANGYANEITDDMPAGLEFLVDNEINKEYRWQMLDEYQEATTDISKAKYIVSDYLSDEQEKATGRNNELKAFDPNAGVTDTNPDYKDVKVAFKVTYVPKTKEETDRTIVNIAQISKDSDDDIDSTPGRDDPFDPKDPEYPEDDIDYDNVKVKYFDLSLLKWVSQTKVTLDGKTVVTDTGHTAETSKNEAPVKLEIASKDIKKVVIKYVYMIQVTNEGEIEGYATEVKDYIPEGLKFESADNTEWKWQIKEDGVVTTDYLKDKLLKPGESATVPIVLTWINGTENLGEKVNLAEISEDKNRSDTPDIDSTPDNKKPGEDDIDDAPIILSVKTGKAQLYLGLISIILVTFVSGIGLIKKYVLEQ